MASRAPFKWPELNDYGDFHTGFRWRLRYFNVVAFRPWPYLIMIEKIQLSTTPCLRAQIREFPRYRQLLVHETGIASLVIRLDVHRVVRVQRRYVVKGTGLLFRFLQKLLSAAVLGNIRLKYSLNSNRIPPPANLVLCFALCVSRYRSGRLILPCETNNRQGKESGKPTMRDLNYLIIHRNTVSVNSSWL